MGVCRLDSQTLALYQTGSAAFGNPIYSRLKTKNPSPIPDLLFSQNSISIVCPVYAKLSLCCKSYQKLPCVMALSIPSLLITPPPTPLPREFVSHLSCFCQNVSKAVSQSVLFYKFHNGLVNCKFPDQVTRSTTSFTRSHCLSYQQLQSSVLAHSYSFFPRTIRVWNLLPSDVATSLSLNSFKQSAMPAIRSLKVPRHLRRL